MSKVKMINGWEDLVGLENDKYYLVIDLEEGNGHIYKKDDKDYYEYLSTHTFYGESYQYYTALLQELGFNVQLKNWDGRTKRVNYKEQWKYSGKCNICKRKFICLVMCSAAFQRLKYNIKED